MHPNHYQTDKDGFAVRPFSMNVHKIILLMTNTIMFIIIITNPSSLAKVAQAQQWYRL